MTYADAVTSILAATPWGLWLQEETSGTTLADASTPARPMTLDGAGIQLNQSGPYGAKAVNYPSAVSSNYAKTAASHATSAATIEVWVWVDNPNLNTTNPTPILCHQATDGSGSNDKNLTLRAVTSTTVRLTWHVNNGSSREVTADLTPAVGGQWFHVVASVGAAGQKIRVDGATLTLNAAVVSSYTTKAQWCQIHKCDVGRGAAGNGPTRVALPAFYTYQLTDAQTDANRAALMAPPPAPPQPPTAHTVTDAAQTQVSTSWTAPATGTAPTGYDVRVDGGAATAVGNVLAHTFTGLTPGTAYTLEVRSTNANGASAWVPVAATTATPQPSAPGIASQAILSAAGLDPNPNGADAPAQQWWDVDAADVATYNDVRSEGLFSYSIGYASREPLGKPQPLSIGVVLLVPVADAVAIGDRFQLRLADALADALGLTPDAAVRATCIVTDVISDPTRMWELPGHGAATLWNVTATGWLSRYGAARVDGTAWPTEPVGARIARVLDSLGLTGDVDTLGADVLPPQTVGTHHQALATAVDSALGRLIEQRDGTVDYSDPGDRRGRTPVLTLDAAEIIGDNFSWRQSVSDVVNSAEVAYGTDTGSSVVVADPASADPRTGVGPYPQQISTVLADELDAYSLGNDLVGRRAWPYYQLPAVTVDLARSGLDLTRLAVAFAILNGDRVALTSMPAGSPWDTIPRGCFIEGYTETATAYAWRLTLVVSDPALSGVSLRYIDVTAGIAYDDFAAGLSYLDVARIEDPSDLL